MLTPLPYEEARLRFRDGDVAFFSHHKQIGDTIIQSWQKINHGEDPDGAHIFSHVGTVFNLGKRTFLLEAALKGGTRMVPLSSRQPDMVASMNLTWTQEAEDFAMENIGFSYGFWESIWAGLGLRESENKQYICTEFVKKISEKMGYHFPAVRQLPSNFYAQLVKEGKNFIWISDPKDTI